MVQASEVAVLALVLVSPGQSCKYRPLQLSVDLRLTYNRPEKSWNDPFN